MSFESMTGTEVYTINARAGVDPAITRYLEDLHFPIAGGCFANLHRSAILLGLEYDSVELQEMYTTCCKADEFHSYILDLAMAFSLDAHDILPGAPFLASTHPADVGDSVTMEEIRQDDERRVSSVIRENEAEIEAV
ncbi:hypothetical protein L873DRAFT_1788731 [Choiromyces venosus 120613-1]|uniref:Uncharacterized protein n=1 Tax=Choiromyces venosus 120613-1 TaxID=1336337 RepID=A0A3N4JUT7_9PEZI|nr:hypothetical protein L873DRAFT_1788731 [Choiromyces venosus 120613-1]